MVDVLYQLGKFCSFWLLLGELEFWFNGHSVIRVGGLTLRVSADSLIKGMHFQTFFGGKPSNPYLVHEHLLTLMPGSTSDWASPIDQKAWFADVSGAIIN